MSDTNKIITEIVTGWVAKDTPFTAYVVFQELRKRGVDVKYSAVKAQIHNEVKSYVTNKIYNVTKVASPTGDTLLYHPPGYDTTKFFDDSKIVI